MSWTIAFRRPDGSFVINLTAPDGLARPYHVTAADPLFPAVSAAAQGVDLPAEPPPVGLVQVILG